MGPGWEVGLGARIRWCSPWRGRWNGCWRTLAERNGLGCGFERGDGYWIRLRNRGVLQLLVL